MNIPKINYYDIKFNKKQLKIILIAVIILIFSLLFRRKIFYILEKLIVFSIIFLLILILTKNIFITTIASFILFLLINLSMSYNTTVENFAETIDKVNSENIKEDKELIKNEENSENEKINSVKNELLSGNSAPLVDLSLFNTDEIKNSSKNLQEIASKLSGKIELKESDTVETSELSLDDKKIEKYSNNNNPSALQQAQKETYDLMNTVAALKDTLTTMTPVLNEGKKLMDMFQNFKI